MRKIAKKITVLFASGSLGGLTNSLVVWLFGSYGITKALGVTMAPAFSAQWLYPRIVWGGIWGALFLLPLYPNRILKRGLLLSLGPTIAQLFIVFPYDAKKGMMGVALGTLTPLFVIFFNAVWGVTAATWIRYLRDG